MYSIEGINPTILSGNTDTAGNGGIGSSNATKILIENDNRNNEQNNSDRQLS